MKLPTVCMITSSYPRTPGDRAGTFVKALADELCLLGHEVHVVAPRDGKPRDPLPGSDVQVHEFAYAPSSRLQVLGYGKSLRGDRQLRGASYLMIGPYVASALSLVVRLSRQRRLDVVHGHWVLPGGLIAGLAGRLLDLPYLVSLHGSDIFLSERNPAFRMAARWTFAGASGTTACSQDLATRAAKLGAPRDSLQVIPYGVHAHLFSGQEDRAQEARRRLGLPLAAPIVATVGRLVDKKGFDYLIRAFPTVLAELPSARLVIAGDGDNLDQLVALTRVLGLAGEVLFPGRVDWREMPDYMALADVFALPSIRDDSGNVDGLPNVLLEAMAAGRAIVASDVGGVSSAIRHGESGILVPEKSSEGLARAIVRLLRDGQLRARLSAGARRTATEEFSWSEVANQFSRLFGGIASRDGT